MFTIRRKRIAAAGAAAALAATMIGAFFVGAFVASMALESNLVRRRPHVYGLLLLGEAGLLAAFFALAHVADLSNARFQDSIALLLCLAMGLQNSLVTRLSGAVVRTTHLTGVVTDLGIEGARWFRYWRAHLGKRAQLRLTLGSTPPARPHAPKSILLVTILLAFIGGAAAGAILAVAVKRLAVGAPFLLLLGGGLYGMLSDDELFDASGRK